MDNTMSMRMHANVLVCMILSAERYIPFVKVINVSSTRKFHASGILCILTWTVGLNLSRVPERDRPGGRAFSVSLAIGLSTG